MSKSGPHQVRNNDAEFFRFRLNHYPKLDATIRHCGNEKITRSSLVASNLIHEARHIRIEFAKFPGVRIRLASITAPSARIGALAMIERINGVKRCGVEDIFALVPEPLSEARDTVVDQEVQHDAFEYISNGKVGTTGSEYSICTGVPWKARSERGR